MDGATPADLSIGKKNARSILLGFKCVFPFKKFPANLAVRYMQMATDPVYILSGYKQNGALEPIAAISRAKVAENFAGCKSVGI
jgi:hypothetical protein